MKSLKDLANKLKTFAKSKAKKTTRGITSLSKYFKANDFAKAIEELAKKDQKGEMLKEIQNSSTLKKYYRKGNTPQETFQKGSVAGVMLQQLYEYLDKSENNNKPEWLNCDSKEKMKENLKKLYKSANIETPTSNEHPSEDTANQEKWIASVLFNKKVLNALTNVAIKIQNLEKEESVIKDTENLTARPATAAPTATQQPVEKVTINMAKPEKELPDVPKNESKPQKPSTPPPKGKPAAAAQAAINMAKPEKGLPDVPKNESKPQKPSTPPPKGKPAAAAQAATNTPKRQPPAHKPPAKPEAQAEVRAPMYPPRVPAYINEISKAAQKFNDQSNNIKIINGNIELLKEFSKDFQDSEKHAEFFADLSNCEIECKKAKTSNDLNNAICSVLEKFSNVDKTKIRYIPAPQPTTAKPKPQMPSTPPPRKTSPQKPSTLPPNMRNNSKKSNSETIPADKLDEVLGDLNSPQAVPTRPASAPPATNSREDLLKEIQKGKELKKVTVKPNNSETSERPASTPLEQSLRQKVQSANVKPKSDDIQEGPTTDDEWDEYDQEQRKQVKLDDERKKQEKANATQNTNTSAPVTSSSSADNKQPTSTANKKTHQRAASDSEILENTKKTAEKLPRSKSDFNLNEILKGSFAARRKTIKDDQEDEENDDSWVDGKD